MNANHANIREEQFWFTAASVAVNTVFLAREKMPSHKGLILVASVFVSLYAAYLILTRWLASAGRMPENPPNARSFNARERFRYARREFRAAFFVALPLVLAELSGEGTRRDERARSAFFYISLIVITCIGVAYRCLH